MASEDPGVQGRIWRGGDSMDQAVSGDQEAGWRSRSLSDWSKVTSPFGIRKLNSQSLGLSSL